MKKKISVFEKNFKVASKKEAKKLIKAYESSNPMNIPLSRPVVFLNAEELKKRIKIADVDTANDKIIVKPDEQSNEKKPKTSVYEKNFSLMTKKQIKRFCKALDKSKPVNMPLSRPIEFATGKELKERLKINSVDGDSGTLLTRQPSPVIAGEAAKVFMQQINTHHPKKARILKKIKERTKNVKFAFLDENGSSVCPHCGKSTPTPRMSEEQFTNLMENLFVRRNAKTYRSLYNAVRKVKNKRSETKIQKEIAALEAMPDSEIDYSDIPETTDFSNVRPNHFCKPNAETLQAMKDTDEEKNIVDYKDADDMFEKLGFGKSKDDFNDLVKKLAGASEKTYKKMLKSIKLKRKEANSELETSVYNKNFAITKKGSKSFLKALRTSGKITAKPNNFVNVNIPADKAQEFAESIIAKKSDATHVNLTGQAARVFVKTVLAKKEETDNGN